MSWLVHNDGPYPIRLHEAWIPHGRFRGEGHLSLDRQVAPGDSTSLELAVRSSEPPGTVVENAFLIVRGSSQQRDWRLFIRMRIEFNARATPTPVIEVVTTQSLQ